MKSEPGEYSIADLARDGRTSWTGIRNYQVRNLFRDEIQIGDIAFFYHSNTKEIGIVGEMRVVSKAYPDPTQFDPHSDHYDPKSTLVQPRWLAIDVEFMSQYEKVLPLNTLKKSSTFKDSALIRKGNRLSVVPATWAHYQFVKTVVH